MAMELHYLAYLAAALPSNEMESMSREDILEPSTLLPGGRALYPRASLMSLTG